MKKIILSFLVFAITNVNVYSQKYFTKNGSISFLSKAKLEDIKADNNQVLSVIDTQTGDLQFSVLVNGFHFPKATMEEHFNEDYMESSKYPKATFKGTITNLSQIDFAKDGTYKATVSGDLTMHGVTKKNFSTEGTITIKGGKISATSKFTVALKDHKIKIPKLMTSNIAEKIEITVSCSYPNKM
ncbi:YceI family protein [Ferruginibacter sp. SUN002]|uniref:YceI family protein n=1 Tax=Ferruginibacter sp. SUN002 TaxID=2937789 RepID=UPI003D366713